MRRLILVLAAAVAVTACSSGPAAEVEHENSTGFLTASDVTRISREAEGFQKDILADGEVTFAEYERATLAAVDCIRHADLPGGTITVAGPHPRLLPSGRADDRFLDYEVEVTGGKVAGDRQLEDWESETGEDVDRIAEGCRADHLADVDRVWTFQHLLSPAERDSQRGQLARCLRGAGLDVPAEATDQDLFTLVGKQRENREAAKCRDTYPDFFLVGVQ